MILHVMIILIQCAAVAAFLILWYFWVKGKLGASSFLEDEDQILFPFRYFSWILAGVILVTCLAQVHFIHVSSMVHERLSGLNDLYAKQVNQTKSIDELRKMITRLQEDMHVNFQGLRAEIAETASGANSAEQMSLNGTGRNSTRGKPDLLSHAHPTVELPGNSFAREARAAAAPRPVKPVAVSRSGPRQQAQPDHFMRLSRQGRVLTDHLRVRNRPLITASVVDKLMTGQQVKVTGKRLKGSKIWYRVVTPTGRAGWVDFRYVRLEGDV